MPIESVSGTGLSYHLIAFDGSGLERVEPDGGKASLKALAALAEEPVTDVFLFSHGWQGDVPAARRQYSSWIGAMAGCKADVERVNQARGGAFRPLLIGLHWPSLPFGDEELGGGGAASFSASMVESPAVEVDAMIDAYASRIADTPKAREALRVIFDRAIDDVAPDELPGEVADACAVLDHESGLGARGEGADPGSDREPFDPESVYQAVKEEDEVSFGGGGLGGLLALPRTLSFWKMKDRARRFGEGGGHDLLVALQAAASGRDIRFHLMGHSFGCVAASAILAGPGGAGTLSRPIDTLLLIQGAFSLWSYCPSIAAASGRPGYFRSVVDGSRVKGPIVTTQSEHDVAVGRWYPLAAGVARQLAFSAGDLPRYGGVGSYGLRGLDAITEDGEVLDADAEYSFQPGRIYNLEGSRIIRENQGAFVGAHSDFARPEIGHAVWSAVLA